jgi:copper resistance protein D
MGDAIALTRFLHFAATMTAAGTIGFCILIVPRAPAAAAFRRYGWIMAWTALAAAVASAALWLLWLAMAISGGTIGEVCRDGTLWTLASQTRFGEVCSVRLLLAAVLSGLLFFSMRATTTVVTLAVAAAFVALLAATGHSGATPGSAGHFFLADDMVHLLAASAWIGALPALAMLLVMARRRDEMIFAHVTQRATQRFSTLGIVCVGALLVTGIVNSWHLLGTAHALLTTSYGRLLSVKIVLFLVLVGIAAVNRYRLTPRLPKATALTALTRNVAAEILLGFGIVFIVGWLGTMAPADHGHTMAGANQPADTHMHHGDP